MRWDLEGIVAKRADSIYEENSNSGSWMEIINRVTVRKRDEGTFSETPAERCFGPAAVVK